MLSEVQEKRTGQTASQDLPGTREPNLQALKAELEANGMFLHAEHMRELQKLSDKRRLQQMTSIFVEKSDPGRCCIRGCDRALCDVFYYHPPPVRPHYLDTVGRDDFVKYVLKIDTTQHVVPDVYKNKIVCRHCRHNEDLNPGVFVGEETAIWLQFIFSEPIRFLPEGIDGSKPLAPQVKALAAATAQATKTKTLDIEDITVGIGTPFVGSNQVAHFRAQVLDAHGTTLTDIGFVHDPEYYHVKPGDTTWKCFRTGGNASFQTGLLKPFKVYILADIVASPSRRKRTTTTCSTQDGSLAPQKHCLQLNLEQHYLDGLYVKVWIEQLQVPTDDSRIIQYDYRPLVDDAVHTQEVLRRATLPGTLVCSQDGCGSCMAVVQGALHRNPQDAFKCKHVADKARELARCSFCKEIGHSTTFVQSLHNARTADLVFIRDVKSGDEAGRRLQSSEAPRQHQTFLLLRFDIQIASQIRGCSSQATDWDLMLIKRATGSGRQTG